MRSPEEEPEDGKKKRQYLLIEDQFHPFFLLFTRDLLLFIYFVSATSLREVRGSKEGVDKRPGDAVLNQF